MNRPMSAKAAFATAAMTALLLLSGCGDKKENATPAVAPPKLSSTIELIAENDGFNKKSATAKPGLIRITVTVPSETKGQHGVGIDGGQYKNIAGAPVKPGRSTSLTVSVKKGDYTIFDSYKNNRDEGFETKLKVE